MDAPAVIERVRSAIGRWREFAAIAEVNAVEVERIAGLLLPLKQGAVSTR